MTTTSATTPTAAGRARVGVQRFGTFLSGMIMPNIPALVAWGIVTAFFIGPGWTPNADLATLVFPIIHYLLPTLIAYTGGSMVYGVRGGVVGAIGVYGAIVGSDLLIDNFNAPILAADPDAATLGYVHMFIGAMIMGPLGGWSMKQLDRLWAGKVKAGFEMLVNMFSAGIWGFVLVIIGFYPVAFLVNGVMNLLSGAVNWLIDTGLLPLTSIIIEPAKVFFLNNAINHGVLTPLGTSQVDAQIAAGEAPKSILFLLEANPGPGLGLLLAFTVFAIGAARASAPGAAVIQFFGGIHEVYFPFALMKPALILALIGGGMTGIATNMVFDSGLRQAAAPGSIIAVIAQTANDSYLGVILSVVLSAAVTFVISMIIFRATRKRDLAAAEAADASFAAAVAQTEANKGKKSDVLSGLAAAGVAGTISNVVFACDAGMGSSAMGATVLRKKFKDAGVDGVTVTNKAIAALDGTEDLVITQKELTDRARGQAPDAVHVSVDNFMNSPKYDEVVSTVAENRAATK